MRLALIQMSMSHEIEENLANCLLKMEQATEQGAQLVIFPELQFSPFFPQYRQQDASKYQMTFDHYAVKKLCQKSSELDLFTVANIYLSQEGSTFDACPVIDSAGQIMGVSKMVHIVQIPQFYEQDYYTPSDEGFKVYDTAIGKLGVVICFDRHYPESIRSCALQGAEIIVIPTAIVQDEPWDLFEWEMRLAAWQNNVFIAMCNRVGTEGQMRFCGRSLIIDPDGDIMAKADEHVQILSAQINRAVVKESRKKRDFITLLRPEMYFR